MTDVAKLQAAYDALVVKFLAPLMSGDVAELGRPVAPGALDYFAQTRSTSAEAESRIFDQLHRLGSEIAPLETVPWPSRDLVGLAMVLHDLLFLTDPSLDRLFARGAREVVLDWIDRLLDLIQPPDTRGEALSRHAMLTAFFATQRRDTVVRNWAYTYRFFGRPVPGNVTALPRLRFVREEHNVIDVLPLFAKLDELAGLGLSPRLRDAVARSPVTELAMPARFAPLRFGIAGLRVLADPALRGGIARQIAASGEWQSASALGAALFAPEMLSATPSLLAPALQLLFEIHVTSTLDARVETRIPSALDPHALRYAAVLPAWLEDSLAIDEIRALDDGDRAVLQRRAEQLRRAIPRAQIDEVAALVTRARTILHAPQSGTMAAARAARVASGSR
ncbi:hypothetical protein [Sandaracinus amylolyticus]|uniref:Uncharacterized protein n=1 Tax=Sandaracinus amylolyticus TaxID=927083 RepID=A0A0F6VZA6_9BACT|nr:hypothetical protein [Sandaracinus amylolyticus]AKF03277.1 hypothetical protein DB32_000426 [Sandaracinus amylolyticus]